jgi:hypothetical protein
VSSRASVQRATRRIEAFARMRRHVVAQLHEAMLERRQVWPRPSCRSRARRGVRLPPRARTARRGGGIRARWIPRARAGARIARGVRGIDGVRVLRRPWGAFRGRAVRRGILRGAAQRGRQRSGERGVRRIGAFVGELGVGGFARPCAPRRCRASARA